jgi:hypothetical protein
VLDAEAILARLDAIMRELVELRSAVVASMPAPATSGNGLDPDPGADFALHNLIDPASAQIRFAIPQNTLRKWARNGWHGAGGRHPARRGGQPRCAPMATSRPSISSLLWIRDATKLSGRAFRLVLARLAQRIAAAPHRLDVVAYSAFAYHVFRGRTPEQGWES